MSKVSLSGEIVASVVALIQDGRSQVYVAKRYEIYFRQYSATCLCSFYRDGSLHSTSWSRSPERTTHRYDCFIVSSELTNRHSTAVVNRNNLQHVINVNVIERTVRRRLNEAHRTLQYPLQDPNDNF